MSSQAIRGVVRNPSTNEPAAGIEVRLEHSSAPGIVVATAVTDETGAFQFPGASPAIKSAQAAGGSPLFNAVFVSSGVALGSTIGQQPLTLSRGSRPSFRLEKASATGMTASTSVTAIAGSSVPRQKVSVRVTVRTQSGAPVPRVRVEVHDQRKGTAGGYGKVIAAPGGTLGEYEKVIEAPGGTFPSAPSGGGSAIGWPHLVGTGSTDAAGIATVRGDASSPIAPRTRRELRVKVWTGPTTSVVQTVWVSPTEIGEAEITLAQLPVGLTIFGRISDLRAKLTSTAGDPVLEAPVLDLLDDLNESGLPDITAEHVEAYRWTQTYLAQHPTADPQLAFSFAHFSRPTPASAPEPGFKTTKPLSKGELEAAVTSDVANGLIQSRSTSQVEFAGRTFIPFVRQWSPTFHGLEHPTAFIRFAYFALAETGAAGLAAFGRVLTSFEWAGGDSNEEFWTHAEGQVTWGNSGLPTLTDFRGLWERFELLEHRVPVFAHWYGLTSHTAAQQPVTLAHLAALDDLAGRSDEYWAEQLFGVGRSDAPVDQGMEQAARAYVMRVRARHDERAPYLAVPRRIEEDPAFATFDDSQGSALAWLRGPMGTPARLFGLGTTRAATHLTETAAALPLTQKANLLALERLLRVRWDLQAAAALWGSPNLYRSASDIARASRASFLAEMSGPLTATVAESVYESAVQIVAAIGDAARFAMSLKSNGVMEHVANPDDVGQVHDTITGGLGSLLPAPLSAGCEACNSVLGPSAYMLDLLSFIGAATVKPVTGTGDPRNLGSEFKTRRPDIELIPLDCDAVNTPVPLLQILNERLAQVVVGAPAWSTSRWPWNGAPSVAGARVKAWERALLFRVADAVSLRHTSLFEEDRLHPMAFGFPGNYTTNAEWTRARWRLAETRLGLHLPYITEETETLGGWLNPSLGEIAPDEFVVLDNGFTEVQRTAIFGTAPAGSRLIAELRTFMRATGLSLDEVRELIRVVPFSVGASPLRIHTFDDIQGGPVSVLTRLATPALPLAPIAEVDTRDLYRFVTLHHATGRSFYELAAGLFWTKLVSVDARAWDLNVVHGLSSLVAIAEALQQPLEGVATWFTPELASIPALGKDNAAAGMSRWQEVFGAVDVGTELTCDNVVFLTPLLVSSLGLTPSGVTAFLRFIAAPETTPRKEMLQSAYRYSALARALQMPLEQLLEWCDITETPVFGRWNVGSGLGVGSAGSEVTSVAERIISTEFCLQRLTALRSYVAEDLATFREIVYGGAHLPPSFAQDVIAWLRGAAGANGDGLAPEEITAYASTFEALVDRSLNANTSGTLSLARVTTSATSNDTSTVQAWLETLLADQEDANVDAVYANEAAIFANAAHCLRRIGLIREQFALSDDELRWLSGAEVGGGVSTLTTEVRASLPSIFALQTDTDLNIQDERARSTSWLRFGAWIDLRDMELDRREKTSEPASALSVLADLLSTAQASGGHLAAALGVEADDLPSLSSSASLEAVQAREGVVHRLARAGRVFAPRRVTAAVAWKVLAAEPRTNTSPPKLSHAIAQDLLAAFEASLPQTLPAATIAKLTHQVAMAEIESRRDLLMAQLRSKTFSGNPVWAGIASAEDPYLYVYERLFIDPLSTAQVKTTRVVEATLAIQTMVNRAVLGQLELVKSNPPSESPTTLRYSLLSEHLQQWEWLKRYRQWEAARKVLLWPENWLRAELRDDQTGAFRQFRDSLGSGPVPLDAGRKAYLAYLREVQRISHMEPVAVSWSVERPTRSKLVRTATVLAAAQDRPNQLYWTRRIEYVDTQAGTRFATWAPWADSKVESASQHVALVEYRGETHMFVMQFEQVGARAPMAFNDSAPLTRAEQIEALLHQAEVENSYVARLHHSTLAGSTWSELTSAADVSAPINVPVAPLPARVSSRGESRAHRPRDPGTFFMLARTSRLGTSPTIGISIFYRMHALRRDATATSEAELDRLLAGEGFRAAAESGRYLRDPYELAHFQYSVNLRSVAVEELGSPEVDGYIELPNTVQVDGQKTRIIVPRASNPAARPKPSVDLGVVNWRLAMTNPDYVLPTFYRPSNRLYAEVTGATRILQCRTPVTVVCPVDTYLPRAGSVFAMYDPLNQHGYVCIPEEYESRRIGLLAAGEVVTERQVEQSGLQLTASQAIAAATVLESDGYLPPFVGTAVPELDSSGLSLPTNSYLDTRVNPSRGAGVTTIRIR